MQHQQPPADIIDRFGHLPDHVYRGNNEHSSACPQCGGERGGHDPSDRFRFWQRQGQASNFWCRRCGFQGFADDNKQTEQPDTVRLLELEEIRQRLAEQEAKRLQALIEDLQQKAYWKGFHDGMSEGHRGVWRMAGIPDSLQDYWQLGFTNYRSYGFESPALTIPYFAPGWRATTIQYRLTNPPAPNDKYRFQAGLKSALWLADPDNEPKNAVLLCEGMKKAAVTFIRTVASGIGNFVVTAVPSKMPGRELLEQLKDADPLYICLDPDAYQGKQPAAKRIGDMIGKRARYVRLPAKADDMFIDYKIDTSLFMNYIKQATKAI